MKRKTVYLAGPMSNLPDYNRDAFEAAEKKLTNEGWQPVNPVDFNEVFGSEPTGSMLQACMDAELAAIPHMDAIYLLRGWEKSKGARAELAIALAHGKQILLEGADA